MPLDKKALLLYAVTDRSFAGRQPFLAQIEDALKGGVTLLQLREKELPPDAFMEEAVCVKKLCRKYGVPLLINDNAELALACGADGVHVGIEDTPVAEIRRRAGKDFIIGATAKTVAQAQAAEKSGADYLGVGAVFPSPTKTNALRITTDTLRQICACVTIPAVAIGGITQENAGTLKNCGIHGIAVVSALFGANDVRQAAAELLETAKAVST